MNEQKLLNLQLQSELANEVRQALIQAYEDGFIDGVRTVEQKLSQSTLDMIRWMRSGNLANPYREQKAQDD